MIEQELCTRCGQKTGVLDRGMYRKIVSRTEEHFLCMKCLAEKFKVPEEAMRERAEFLRETCSLFY